MNSEILVALLSLAGTLLGSLGGVLASSKLTNYRLSQLEKKVDRHNGCSDTKTSPQERPAGLFFISGVRLAGAGPAGRRAG